MHCLLIFFSWGLLAPKPLGVFRYRLLSYTSTWDCSSMLNLRQRNDEDLNSAAFFLVRKFYMLRCLFGTLYVDMRCFGVSWVFSKHKIPHPNQWGSMKNHKEVMFIQGRLLSSRFYLYTGSERSAFQCAPILLAR